MMLFDNLKSLNDGNDWKERSEFGGWEGNLIVESWRLRTSNFTLNRVLSRRRTGWIFHYNTYTWWLKSRSILTAGAVEKLICPFRILPDLTWPCNCADNIAEHPGTIHPAARYIVPVDQPHRCHVSGGRLIRPHVFHVITWLSDLPNSFKQSWFGLLHARMMSMQSSEVLSLSCYCDVVSRSEFTTCDPLIHLHWHSPHELSTQSTFTLKIPHHLRACCTCYNNIHVILWMSRSFFC
jgi:hypothetical protein